MKVGTSKYAYNQDGKTIFGIDATSIPSGCKITYFQKPDPKNPRYIYVFGFEYHIWCNEELVEGVYTLIDILFPKMDIKDLRKVDLGGGSLGFGNIKLTFEPKRGEKE